MSSIETLLDKVTEMPLTEKEQRRAKYGEARVKEFVMAIGLYATTHPNGLDRLRDIRSPEFRTILGKSLELGMAPGLDCDIVPYKGHLTLVPTHKGLTKLLQTYWPGCHLTHFVWFEEHMKLCDNQTPTGTDRPPSLPRGTIDYNATNILKKVRLIQVVVFEANGNLKTYKNYDFDWLVAKLKGVTNPIYDLKEGKRNQDALEMYIKTAKKHFLKEFALHNSEHLLYDLERAVAKERERQA